MNETTATPPPLIAPPAKPIPPSLPLGLNAGEAEPIAGPFSAAEALLRQPRRVMFQLQQGQATGLVLVLLLVALACSAVYGLVVGTFSGGDQLWAAPVKILGGLFLSALICLPSLYIFACLGGARAGLIQLAGLVAGLLAQMTVLMIGFAPVAWVFSQSTESVLTMGALHLVFWVVSTCFGLRFLSAGFGHLSMRSSAGLRVWTVVFLLVALQMTTALRPIVGTADTFLPTAKKFFLRHWADCARGGQQR